MTSHTVRSLAILSAFSFLIAGAASLSAQTSSSNAPKKGQSSSSAPEIQQEKAPPTLDPAGPMVSLISAEPIFTVAAALNTCGYDEGLSDSAPVRQKVRDDINQAMAKSEDARAARDKLCLYIAQHRMTGTERDISQYISLALYLTPPPDLEMTEDLADMPPDSTQVAEVVPLLKDFVDKVDLHGIWITVHHSYDEEEDKLHEALTQMVVSTNLYLKIPAAAYNGLRFIVVIEPLLSPSSVNARIYGTDYVVVVSPSHGTIRMTDVRHTYLHFLIDPLLLSRANAIDRTTPVLKVIRDAPLEYRFRSDTVALTIECLIKGIEARTMDTGIPEYKIPSNIDRSQLPIYEEKRQAWQQKVDAVKLATVHHDMTQGFVLTQYFYSQLMEFEKDPASLPDTIGEMVYSMDVDDQVRHAKMLEFDKEADEDVLQRSKPRQLTGLDLAEARLADGDVTTATALARQSLIIHDDTLQSTADSARANFILARAAILTGHPDQAIDEFQKTLATSKDARLLSWSHIYLGRMLDLDCKRDQALEEYKLALTTRDGALDTRLAAERGVKAAYAVRGHTCEEDADDDATPAKPAAGPDVPQKQ